MLIAISAVLTFIAGLCGLVLAYFAVISLKNKDYSTFLIGTVFFIINVITVFGFIFDIILAK
ncbi:hypothetical protein [Priestia megaterium]|uniref:hypothetical protein n=1 Tax=Priestia megaterium TaxID=1404 RepID=UPI000BFB7C98|nr:hypothetical protein [Priestia megaterium]PGO60753.1 hypothetical protein CN981_09455 [Priestia megaterium]